MSIPLGRKRSAKWSLNPCSLTDSCCIFHPLCQEHFLRPFCVSEKCLSCKRGYPKLVSCLQNKLILGLLKILINKKNKLPNPDRFDTQIKKSDRKSQYLVCFCNPTENKTHILGVTNYVFPVLYRCLHVLSSVYTCLHCLSCRKLQ